MSFDAIPEDKKESFPCGNCEAGSVSLNEEKTAYECDTCNAYYEVQVKE